MDDTSVMLSSASLLPAGKCYCLGFCKSWDIRANQRLVGPVKIWFPDNQVQEENCGWLVGWLVLDGCLAAGISSLSWCTSSMFVLKSIVYYSWCIQL